MHDIGIQCCFDPICYKTVETQTDQMSDASTNVCERTSNELPLPGQDQDGAHISVNTEESKVKHEYSCAMQPWPKYVIFLKYEDDSFNAISPPPPYKVEVVIITTTEDPKSK